MKKIKDNMLLILVSVVIVLLVIIILLLLNVKVFSSSNNVDNKESNTKDTKEIKKDDDRQDNNVDPTPSPSATPVPTPTPSVPTQPVQDIVPDLKIDKNENNVVKFFEEKSSAIKSGDSRTLREKAKDGFITVVDFIFYDKEIKGYKFKELTNSAKLKIISLALSIDNKIDKYFPGYKDEIKGKYTSVKSKLAEKYLEYSAKLCETVGDETCNSAKEGWEKLKKNFSLTGELLKDLGKDAGDKIKTWYENFRDNN